MTFCFTVRASPVQELKYETRRANKLEAQLHDLTTQFDELKVIAAELASAATASRYHGTHAE